MSLRMCKPRLGDRNRQCSRLAARLAVPKYGFLRTGINEALNKPERHSADVHPEPLANRFRPALCHNGEITKLRLAGFPAKDEELIPEVRENAVEDLRVRECCLGFRPPFSTMLQPSSAGISVSISQRTASCKTFAVLVDHSVRRTGRGGFRREEQLRRRVLARRTIVLRRTRLLSSLRFQLVDHGDLCLEAQGSACRRV